MSRNVSLLALTNSSGIIYKNIVNLGKQGTRNVGRGWNTLVVETEMNKGWSLWCGYVDIIVLGKTLAVEGR